MLIFLWLTRHFRSRKKKCMSSCLCHYSWSPAAASASALELAGYISAGLWKRPGRNSVKSLKLTRRYRPKCCMSHRLSKQSRLQKPHQPTTGRRIELVPAHTPALLLSYRGGTYCEHGHGDAHGGEHRVGHRAALIAQLDAVVIAEEPSLVRRQGKLVQKHGNKHHCMVKPNPTKRKKKNTP